MKDPLSASTLDIVTRLASISQELADLHRLLADALGLSYEKKSKAFFETTHLTSSTERTSYVRHITYNIDKEIEKDKGEISALLDEKEFLELLLKVRKEL